MGGTDGLLYDKIVSMKWTKSQVRTLLVVNSITLILFVGILFLPWVNPFFGGTKPVDADPEPPPVNSAVHDPLRSPRPAADSALAWETNLGGSGNETVVAAFETASGVLIFGNTESSDYDFKDKTPGGFVILLGFNGKVVNYLMYEGEIAKVYGLDDGFLLCVNSATECLLLRTDSLGIGTGRVNLREAETEKIIDVYTDWFSANQESEPFHAVVEYQNPNTGYKELRVHALSDKLEERYKRWFSRSQSLEYVAAYSHPNGFFLLANIKGLNTSMLTYYNWRKNSSTENDFNNLTLQLIDRYTCEAVIPAGANRYAALIRTADNIPYFIDCNQDFTRHPIHELGAAPAEKVMLLSDNETVYVYVYRAGDISALFRFDETLAVIDEVAAFKKFSDLYCHTLTSRGTLFCGRTVNGVTVAGVNQNGVAWERAFNSQNETIRACIETNGGLILIGESTGKGYNVGGNFGGSDIWAAKLLF